MELSRSRASLREEEAKLQVDKEIWFYWCCYIEDLIKHFSVMGPHSVLLYILCRALEKNCGSLKGRN